MNNFIIISKTFADTTPESAEHGDYSDRGFIDECMQVTFSELVELMKEHNQPSMSPNDGNVNVWYSCSPYTTDYSKGIERETSIHFHRSNTPNASKYWKLAAKFANIN